MTAIAIIRRAGFRDHEATIQSTHGTVEAAKRALARHAYTDARGVRVQPCGVVAVERDMRKGAVIWFDCLGERGVTWLA